MNAVRQGGQVPATVQGLFKGVAVVIDDNIDNADNPDDGINEILRGVEAGGGYAIKLSSLPAPEVDLENFSNAAFFIMDWNLTGLPFGTQVPAALMANQVEDNARFLLRLREHRHAPVFIFTNEDEGAVRDALIAHNVIHPDTAESHIFIRNKNQVGADVYKVLNDWASETPSALALRTWERSYIKAVNALFTDFHERSRYWPVMFWQGFKRDKVPPGDELGRLITRLVASRMHPFNADLDPFEDKVDQEAAADPDGYRNSLLSVLEGERVVLQDRLEQTSFAPGDFFEIQENGVTKYLLNIRAECDCVIRGTPRRSNLYLIRGKIVENVAALVNHDAGNLFEKDNEAIVFAMLGGKTFSFSFRDLDIRPWPDLQHARKARLLAPFITRIMQRYAAYSQRPGLPRVPAVLLGAPQAAAAIAPAPGADPEDCAVCA